jgi:TRAP-type mannitol/chloroaromatic compound transport system permease small subunit
LQRVQHLSLTALGVCLIVLILAIVAQVICSALDINPLLAWEAAYPLIGKAITLNSLLEFQWHLLVIAGLLPAGLIWLMDRHVRVDFIYMRQEDRLKARIDLFGNLMFAAPFFVLVLPAAWTFTERAWRSDEASRNGGLVDLWMIKSVLPLGLALMALAVAVECIRLMKAAR